MLWLALHCPGLPLAVFAATDPAMVVVVERHAGSDRVVAVGNHAEQAGVVPGMNLAAARARCPRLTAWTRDRAAEESALQQLAEAGLHFTDHVTPEPPLDLLLEIGRSRRLFGGLESLLADIDAWLARCRHAILRGIAPTPAAARLLARAGGGRIGPDESLPEALGTLPAALAAPDAEAAGRLAGWGIERLEECLQLPRAGLSERLGPAFVDALDRITGRRAESIPRFRPAPRFHARLALPQASGSLQSILAATGILCTDLADWLSARDAAIQAFVILLYPQRGAAVRVEVGLVVPGREAGHFLDLSRERLERTHVPEEIIAVGLQSERPAAYVPPPADLWLDAGGEPPERLLERLRARLGRDAVRGLALRADHRPERAWAWSDPGRRPEHEPVSAPARPLWLLRNPAALAIDDDCQPRLAGPLQLLAGPERIETGWWDGGDVERDYFIARSRIGLVVWIYRERRRPRYWFVQGLFG